MEDTGTLLIALLYILPLCAAIVAERRLDAAKCDEPAAAYENSEFIHNGRQPFYISENIICISSSKIKIL